MKTTTRVLSIIFVLALLAACTPAPAPTLAPTAMPTATFTPPPTAAPTPEPEPTPTAKVEIPLEQLPATIAAATEFANAMTAAGTPITPEQVLQPGLVTKEITGQDGKKYEIASTQDGYPLMMKSEGRVWVPTTDRIRDNVKGINLGAFFGGNNTTPADFEKITQIITNDFSLGGIYVGGSSIQPTEGIYELDTLKWLLGNLKNNNQTALIHPLIWFNDSPDWMKSKSQEQLIATLTDQVTIISKEVESMQLQKKPILTSVLD